MNLRRRSSSGTKLKSGLQLNVTIAIIVINMDISSLTALSSNKLVPKLESPAFRMEEKLESPALPEMGIMEAPLVCVVQTAFGLSLPRLTSASLP